MTVGLHTHRPTVGALGEAGDVEPRQTGRPEEVLPRALTTALLSERLWPTTSTTLTVILGRRILPHAAGVSGREKRCQLGLRTGRHHGALTVKGKVESEAIIGAGTPEDDWKNR